MTIPKVFVSYSHDSVEHKKWALDLATRLRSSGVDAQIDQWDLKPGDDLGHFMETQLTVADRVLMVCTDKYVEKANAGTGGVGYEKMIVTAALLSHIDSNKVIPLIKQSGTANVPTFLKSKVYLDFSTPERYEYSFDELVRTLHNAPLYEKPPITSSPFPVRTAPALPVKDGMKELMTAAVSDFESTTTQFLHYSVLVKSMNISRVMLDVLFADAVVKGYLHRHNHELYQLTASGKKYALENNISQ
jgi:hypothetical protein